jgi:cold shock protein
MPVGRVVRFNETKGYGFVAPDGGGDDVFIHANELAGLGVRVGTGTRVTFEVVDGERGPKAYDVALLPDQPTADADPSGGGNGSGARQVVDDELFDVLSEREFTYQITELLLVSAPQLTGEQVRELRGHLLRFARDHGWVD